MRRRFQEKEKPGSFRGIFLSKFYNGIPTQKVKTYYGIICVLGNSPNYQGFGRRSHPDHGVLCVLICLRRWKLLPEGFSQKNITEGFLPECSSKDVLCCAVGWTLSQMSLEILCVFFVFLWNCMKSQMKIVPMHSWWRLTHIWSAEFSAHNSWPGWQNSLDAQSRS